MTDQQPKSRRLRFPRYSLRTLFVVVTTAAIPAAWAGYNWNWIRQRNEIRREWNASQRAGSFPTPYPPAPSTLGLFGEKGYGTVGKTSPAAPTEDDIARMNRIHGLFPEAIVFWKEEYGETTLWHWPAPQP